MNDLIARLRAGTVTPSDLDAAADALERMPAEVWRRAMDAAAQKAREELERRQLYIAMQSISAAIRDLPMPDDLR